MRHQTRDGCVKSPLKRIQAAWIRQCHKEGGRVGTIGVLGRPGTPRAPWGAAGSATTCPGPPPSSTTSPLLTPTSPTSSNSTAQNPPGTMPTRHWTSVSSWWLPATAQPCRWETECRWGTDELREEMDGDITTWSDKDQGSSLLWWPERHNYVGDGDGVHEGDTAWERAWVQGDLHLLHPEHHQQHQHQLQQQHLRVQLRGGGRRRIERVFREQTDQRRECFVWQAYWDINMTYLSEFVIQFHDELQIGTTIGKIHFSFV